jgi:hypothetical protein
MPHEHAPRPLGHEARTAFEAYLRFSEGEPVDLADAIKNLSEEELLLIDEHMRRLRKAIFMHVEFSRTHDETTDLRETFRGFSGAEVQYMSDKADDILRRAPRFFAYGKRRKK